MKENKRQFNFSDLLKILIAAMLFLNLNGCADLKEMFDVTKEDVDVDFPAKDLVVKGMEDYNVGKYFTAADYFKEITEKYPFSPEALLAELKLADSYYYMEKFNEGLIQYEDFSDRHPTNEAIPYVIYQRGMCYYKQIDRIDRDPILASLASEQFNQLIRSFPESPYTKDANARIAETRVFLADHEYSVVEFYLRTGKYDQAKTRIQYLLTVYPESKAAPAAREILQQIEEGNPPNRPVLSWFPDVDLPEWGEAAKDPENTVDSSPKQ
ncbi:MAG: outer membrane protein assembly factor BamD [Desulfotalea sp.]